MHTFQAPSGVRFHYNSDESGDVYTSSDRASHSLTCSDLRAFVAYLDECDGVAVVRRRLPLCRCGKPAPQEIVNQRGRVKAVACEGCADAIMAELEAKTSRTPAWEVDKALAAFGLSIRRALGPKQ